MGFPVFRMLLQPLVENSIFHGYNGGGIEGPITIHAFREGSTVIIEVIDQGEGISTGILEHILVSEPGDVEVRRKRIGLNNIHDRIRLHYGEQFGLQIISIPKQITRVRAVFPAGLCKGDA